MTRVFLNKTVYDAALDRMRWLFDEFDNIIVNSSGGKDSTIIVNLALIVAEERGRLPLDVMFIDQEAEWGAVIDYIKRLFCDPRINPIWLQIPIKLFNATSNREKWLHCWEPGKEWIRDKEVGSVHKNVFGTNRFGAMFAATSKHYYPDSPAIHIAGVRAEESPGRLLGLTNAATYKGATWGKVDNKFRNHYTFYPIYDWSYTDVWKAINDNQWDYCKIYDYMYQYGIETRDMRVSNVHHETAIRSLYFLQEIEPDTWDKITNRLAGISTAGQLREQFTAPRNLPYMFDSWKDYRDYLLDKLVKDDDVTKAFNKQFSAHEGNYIPIVQEKLNKTEVQMILVNDYHGTKYSSFTSSHSFDMLAYRAEMGLPIDGRLPSGYNHYVQKRYIESKNS